MGVEPMNTGFADQRVSHFATGAHIRRASKSHGGSKKILPNQTRPTGAGSSYEDRASQSYTQGRSSPHRRWKLRQ
jgi:hypothetical protein